ncbi:tetratricopeptide repeat-containing serine/threonine-protein kinase [Paraliomyxa miuraensis]|uniref:tetratricopeptide repeat-containing serine/threonine-protein kinase n=1 Tax=Paraliomyxa miuraensis TaxID=376150 RepID=UPI002252895E|nr:tetratricopeptide repeat-containing serine/threonine-protein kinase [Paraliomyxa miuraensis]MCX4240833.1 serine/threonine-protein kinase [Paraliomyxa miuraensis]
MPVPVTPPTVSADGALVEDDARPASAEIQLGTPVGRYLLLDTIGRGGMGVVYSAYDPDLDRKVAIKVLRSSTGRNARGRLLREAQALARLTHPNVVTIHDVGMVGDDVYLAMELVLGQTVDQWLAQRKRSWKEVLRVYLAAGEGLAAAHDKGIVHRDFKPSNVMLDDVGGVRVLDFGLARLSDVQTHGSTVAHQGALPRLVEGSALLTRPDGLTGTPAYMAPEQFLGQSTDARTDQFSFCVALWEAICGVPPFAGEAWDTLSDAVLEGRLRAPPRSAAPSWLLRALVRGLTREPERRFASMAELLAALERGLGRRRRRPLWLLGGLTIALGLGTAGYRSHAHHRQVTACAELGAALPEGWSDAARGRLAHALRNSEQSYAADTADRLLPRLDAWVGQWGEQREQSCLLELDGRLDPVLAQRSRECLDAWRTDFEALVGALHDVDAITLPGAIQSSTRLDPLERCTDPRLLALRPELPAEDADEIREARRMLAEAKGQRVAGDPLRAVESIERVVSKADAIGYGPLLADAKLEQGYVLGAVSRFEAAQAALEQAYLVAVTAGAHEAVAAAATELVYVVGSRRNLHDAGLAWATVAEAAVGVVEPQAGLRTANLHQVLAAISGSAGDYEQVRAHSERAIGIREQLLGPEHPSIAGLLNNIATATRLMGDPEQAIPVQEHVLAVYEASLGPRHPAVAEHASSLALTLVESGRAREAIALLERARGILVEALGEDGIDVAKTLHELAYAHQALGERAPAEALLRQALDIRERAPAARSRDLAATVLALAVLRHADGDLDEARSLAERALRIYESEGAEHPDLAVALQILGSIHEERGALEQARELYERALALREQLYGPEPNDAVTESLAGLARVLHRSGQLEQARELYERAPAIEPAPTRARDEGLPGAMGSKAP